MKKLIALTVAAGAFAEALPLAANAQEVTVVRERTRVCYDSYGDRTPCTRCYYYRSYDDGYYYRPLLLWRSVLSGSAHGWATAWPARTVP